MNSTKQVIAESFSRSACRYDQAAYVQQQAGQELLVKMSDHIHSGQDISQPVDARSLCAQQAINVIADVGCGTGYFSRTLVQKYSPTTYMGIDLANGMLKVAAEKNRVLNNAVWICDDAEQLSLADDSVDIIFANFALQWSDNLPRLLRTFRRILKPGGWCCYTTLDAHSLYELRESWSQVDPLNHINRFYTKTDWQQAIDAEALHTLEYYRSTHIAHFNTAKEALRSLKDIGANTVMGKHRQSLTGKQRFNHFLAAYEQYRTNKGLPITYEIDGWILQKPLKPLRAL